MKLKIFLLTAATLMCSFTARGQGCNPDVQLTSSESISTSGDLSTLYVSSQVFGNIDMQGGYCGFNITHTPSAEAGVVDLTTNTATNDFYQSGLSVCASCYINESVSTSVALRQSDQYRIDQGEQVHCSNFGTFFVNSSQNNGHVGVTYSQNTHTPAPPSGVYIVDWCTPESTPPDYEPNVVQSSNPNVLASGYFNGASWCTRPTSRPVGSTWSCNPNPSPIVTPKSDTTLHVCTNWDKGTKGVYP